MLPLCLRVVYVALCSALASGQDPTRFSVIIGLSLVVMDAIRTCGVYKKTLVPSMPSIIP